MAPVTVTRFCDPVGISFQITVVNEGGKQVNVKAWKLLVTVTVKVWRSMISPEVGIPARNAWSMVFFLTDPAAIGAP